MDLPGPIPLHPQEGYRVFGSFGGRGRFAQDKLPQRPSRRSQPLMSSYRPEDVRLLQQEHSEYEKRITYRGNIIKISQLKNTFSIVLFI